MDRRVFLFRMVGGTGITALPFVARADLACVPQGPGVEACTAGLRSAIASITMRRPQQKSNWCWAACLEMVFRYHGLEVSQETIVEETLGDDRNLPGSPGEILENLNRTWTVDDDDYTVEADTYTVTPGTVAQDLANDFPLIIGSMGHAMVLTGVQYYRRFDSYGNIVGAVVRDPWPGRGKRSLSAAEWALMSFAVRIRVSAS